MEIKAIGRVVLIAIGAASMWFGWNVIDEEPKDKRQEYNDFVSNHPMNQGRKVDLKQWEKMPKADRPDLAWEQNFIMTMDPALGYPTPERLVQAKSRIEAAKNVYRQKNAGILDSNLPDLVWEERGPYDVGGRTRAIMYDPNDSSLKKVWAGAVSGGLWYNTDITDANNPWVPVDDFWTTLGVSCITHDPTDPQTFYVGTGEGYGSSGSRGQGVFKSTDAGLTWTQLSASANFDHVRDIAVRDENGQGVLYVAVKDANYWGFTPSAGNDEGLFRSTDGGQSFSQVIDSIIPNQDFNYAISDIEIAADNRIWLGTTRPIGASSAQPKGGGDILYSDDGINFVRNRNIDGSRVEIACAPSDPNVLYALVEHRGRVERVIRTVDRGNTWQAMPEPNDDDPGIPANDFSRGQAWYDLIAQVDPNDPYTVVVGGINLFRSTDTANTWEQLSHWYGGFGYPYVHADQHQFIFKPGSSSEIISGSDGGIAYSSNFNSAFPSFAVHNAAYNTTQYYAGDIGPTAGGDDMVAGSQDNGTEKFYSPGMGPTQRATGGDGAYCFINEFNPNFWITSYVYNAYWRSYNNGNSFGGRFINNSDGRFINPADFDANLDILYACKSASDIYRYANVSGNVDEETINVPGMRSQASHLKVSPFIDAEATLYVGSGSGVLVRIDSADIDGSEVITDITGANFPVAYLSCVEVGRTEDELIATFANYGVSSVFYTNDGGQTWENKEGDLPDMPVRWALFNPRDYDNVILATELGVWETRNFSDPSPNWVPANNGLANVRVDMLQLRKSDYTIMAITHGRGVYTAQFAGGIGLEEDRLAAEENSINVYPNPLVDHFQIDFDQEGIWELQLFDMKGKLRFVDRWSHKSPDKVFRPGKLEAGVYIASLRKGEEIHRLQLQVR